MGNLSSFIAQVGDGNSSSQTTTTITTTTTTTTTSENTERGVLTKGGVERLVTLSSSNDDRNFRPFTIQVVDIKPGKNEAVITLNDGKYCVGGVFVNKTPNVLQENSLIVVHDFDRNIFTGNCIFLSNFTLLEHNVHKKIGNPLDITALVPKNGNPFDMNAIAPEDEVLTATFRQDCPICMLPLPLDGNQVLHFECCSKAVCDGCVTRSWITSIETKCKSSCAFCRADIFANDQELLARIRYRSEKNDCLATFYLAKFYHQGRYGLPIDHKFEIELLERASHQGSSDAIGSADAAFALAFCHDPQNTESPAIGKDKQVYQKFLEQAAKGGQLGARILLGGLYLEAGDHELAAHHIMVAAYAGDDGALDSVKQFFIRGFVTKDDYANALRSHQAANDERKSPDREMAKKYLIKE